MPIAQYVCSLEGDGCDEVVEATFGTLPIAAPACPVHDTAMLLAGFKEEPTSVDPLTVQGHTRAKVGGKPGDTEYIGIENAVLLEGVEFSRIHASSHGSPEKVPAICMSLTGKINKRPDDVSLLFLMPTDGLAGIVTEALALADRIGDEYRTAVYRRVVEMTRERLTDQVEQVVGG